MGSGQNSSEEVVRDLITALQNYSQAPADVCKSKFIPTHEPPHPIPLHLELQWGGGQGPDFCPTELFSGPSPRL